MKKLKIISWNVNGIRASVNKGFYDVVSKFQADCFLVQETKAGVDIVMEIAGELKGYHCYANEAEKKGYSGTAVFTREKARGEYYTTGVDVHDHEGRITGLEFEDHILVNVYVPNSGSEMKRLDYRKSWDRDFLKFITGLNKNKPVIVGGDFNVAHQAIDLARPKENYNKTSGYTQVEIDGIGAFFEAGFTDSYRTLHPEDIQYTFWNQRFKARERNVGWRIDYFLLSPELKDKLATATIYNHVQGSDHCPIGVEINF